jgi:hypothetical protein
MPNQRLLTHPQLSDRRMQARTPGPVKDQTIPFDGRLQSADTIGQISRRAESFDVALIEF